MYVSRYLQTFVIIDGLLLGVSVLGQALPMVNTKIYCRSHRSVNIFPYVYRRSVELIFKPIDDVTNPSSETRGQDGSTTRDAHAQRENHQPLNTTSQTPADNTSAPPSKPAAHVQNSVNLASEPNGDDSLSRLFTHGTSISQLGKCRILFKCAEASCRHLVHIRISRPEHMSRSRKMTNLRVLDGKSSDYRDMLYSSHIPLHIGPPRILQDELCSKDAFCQSSGNFVTVTYDVNDDQWFQPFNITLTLFLKEEHGDACQWSYMRCELSRLCIPRSLACDGERNCGAHDDTDERHCPGRQQLPAPLPDATDMSIPGNDSTRGTAYAEKVAVLSASHGFSMILLVCSLIFVGCAVALLVLYFIKRIRKGRNPPQSCINIYHTVGQQEFFGTTRAPSQCFGDVRQNSTLALPPAYSLASDKDKTQQKGGVLVAPYCSANIYSEESLRHSLSLNDDTV